MHACVFARQPLVCMRKYENTLLRPTIGLSKCLKVIVGAGRRCLNGMEMQCRFYSHITFVHLGKQWGLLLPLHIPPLLRNCFSYNFTSWIVSHGYSNSWVDCEGCCFMSLFFILSTCILLFQSVIQMFLEFYCVKLGMQGLLLCIPVDT